MAGKSNIGEIDQRVTFQSETVVDDGQGGVVESGWANIPSTPVMWARVTQSSGSEGERGEYRQANEYPIDVVVRNRSDLTEKMSLVWRQRRYNIRSILPFDARREFLIISATGGVPM